MKAIRPSHDNQAQGRRCPAPEPQANRLRLVAFCDVLSDVRSMRPARRRRSSAGPFAFSANSARPLRSQRLTAVAVAFAGDQKTLIAEYAENSAQSSQRD